MSLDHNKLCSRNMKNNKIIKWSGSKTYLSEEIDKFVTEAMLKGTLNNRFNYFEPFLIRIGIFSSEK